jgi:glycyl-tRNA synthetase beta chain
VNASRTLLVELLTEELPPRALQRLGDAFAEHVAGGLRAHKLLDDDASVTGFATPRRLAVSIRGVRARSPDQQVREKIMPVAVAFAPDGSPTLALRKKLAAMGLPDADVACLERASDGKAESLFSTRTVSGVPLDTGLQPVLAEAVQKLPIPKVMSYQRPDGSTVHFVRPAHGLVALHGSEIVLVTVLGLLADRSTRGHRFQGDAEIVLRNADEYEDRLEADGAVIAGYARRRTEISRQIHSAAARLGAVLHDHEALLDEVTALVENPTVYVGEFEAAFLGVPQECLILTMQQNQKYFPLFDASGKLLSRFLIVSNMRLDDPSRVVRGNERVIRPRLADARFFFDTDRRERLETRVERLGSVVYHARLGTQLERVARLRALARTIAADLGATPAHADRAALLCKADLVTLMVGEFPELQGVMGRYYAVHDGEHAEVADAIASHYRPRFAGDALPSTRTGAILALADKVDALVGIFGIGLAPTGDKDPFALRRQALGVIRLLVELVLPLDTAKLLRDAAAGFAPGTLRDGTTAEVHRFVLDRLRGYLRESGCAPDEIESVAASEPTRFDDLVPRLAAVRAFRELPEAESLASANKRIANILRKSGGAGKAVDPARLTEPAERALHAAVAALAPVVDDAVGRGDHASALLALAGIRVDVDRFFEQVLVNADDPSVRANRLALLQGLHALMSRVADIGRLAG